MSNQLEELKKCTTVVADSGEFEVYKEFKPKEATTNPSLLYAAAQKSEYGKIVEHALEYVKKKSDDPEKQVILAMDKLAVDFGVEILKIVPGRVSTEIDARLSFDTAGTLAKCKELIQLYKDVGVDTTKRVLFKIASTWEGIQAAKQLESEGIHVNMTLMFGFPQAVAAAEAKATLVSPFVGRITDFWKQEKKVDSFKVEEDPGVLSVKRIYNYYKKYDYKTIVMGASFRTREQIVGLAGCDYLTISPSLLKELSSSTEPLHPVLKAEEAKKLDIPKVTFDEKSFRWEMNEDPCATVKLAEGIRNFTKDAIKLEALVRAKLKESKK
eukprot:TRINITY_DN694_c0_g1_i4.p1 TRINITY_DN694_c0_g1~~TRINITY_DN694_c0_g1_i4.p1  ORF type:complete len:326 (-),score=66.70 TRINITY_DN694_c0_g1_i4:31-1008(-)